MSKILPALVLLIACATPALAADMPKGQIHPGWGVQAPVAVAPQASATVVEELGSPPLPYRGFEYPLDDASWFYPPHPAAETYGTAYGYAGRRVIAAPPSSVPSALPFSHVNWCNARYASYRATDNTFLPPRGGRRTCVSPYL
ncbi:BA14K family protein [Aliihoeflea sp. 40Bstr573]|uniref:BA14K family protein n=1 Tax=Aliihoeflea sp. 40Bstr573 TaxID=2696467 RepID=UPI0020965018